jgi:hypothetical protein
MADKTVLCVSLLFSLLVFHPLCGLQGVNASPTRQLNSLRSEYSEKTSLIQTRVSGAGKPLPAPLAKVEYGELLITVEIYESDNPINATLSVTHLDGWLVYSLSSVTTWFGGKGKVFFNDGGVGYDHWAIRWELPGLVSATTEIKVGIYREVSHIFHFLLIEALCYKP